MGQIIFKLDEMMAKRKVSLGDLAGQIGITNVNLSKIKNNHVTAVRFSTLAALCDALECEVEDLLAYQPSSDAQPYPEVYQEKP